MTGIIRRIAVTAVISAFLSALPGAAAAADQYGRKLGIDPYEKAPPSDKAKESNERIEKIINEDGPGKKDSGKVKVVPVEIIDSGGNKVKGIGVQVPTD